MTIEELKERKLILFETISGSRAYGTNLPTSDTDIKGVFVLSQDDFYGLHYVEQVSNETNDIVYYELKRFVELLLRNNPNVMEMLNSPEDCVLYKHPLFEQIDPSLFLSKLCKQTFAGYAMTQVQKARGLNKKILNPVEEERKDVTDFCYVTYEGITLPVKKWLEAKGFLQEHCGLVNLNHLRNMYALYYDSTQELGFKGIIRKDISNEVSLSSVPKEMKPEAYLYFNKEGYSSYCRDYREYWEWVEKRNDERYQNTLQHGKNYDAKNMMHTIRLLEMAEDIAVHKKIIVRRPNREYLLQIRRGEYSYEELVALAEEKIQSIEMLFMTSDLPEQPDMSQVNELLILLRKQLYQL
ncbi:DNA polymerase beta superfamily protein [Xanthocytophaga agilis]|uniref:Nucleotidyltransferase domain-containing protein n=1 Tax=Xanthocytophaga agilis TaxID=3048010 RepID=A0AAE3UDA8_9BACT|nr:nucleotidyltransferase domain-containing protein [Xanthocytophaga agilis]MDJ1501015.1 nucleotidyltransferase domain-containing protein [Xanthocytophaga agilis]